LLRVRGDTGDGQCGGPVLDEVSSMHAGIIGAAGARGAILKPDVSSSVHEGS
jgi:hypothetical protein